MSMNNQNPQDAVQSSDADIFREKAQTYLVCFIRECPLRTMCLRYLVGEYVGETPFSKLAINPHNPQVGKPGCPRYRDNGPKVMKFGFTRMYADMPGRMERAIRQALIAYFGRKRYFEMRKGDRPIVPSHQYVIEQVCRDHGWTGPIVYDGERMEYEW